MAILGITNRTENWKTARYFAPLFGANSVRLARRLLGDDEERRKLHPGDVRLELFWYGMRDYLRRAHFTDEEGVLANAYQKLFVTELDLRASVSAFADKSTKQSNRLRKPSDGNYNPSADDWRGNLRRNLRSTEVDIVLDSGSHIFIGEAKHLSRLDAKSSYALAHQLIRQYVMAKILVELRGTKHTVVPFIVSDGGTNVENSGQVQFMCEQGWMRAENILTWSDIEALW